MLNRYHNYRSAGRRRVESVWVLAALLAMFAACGGSGSSTGGTPVTSDVPRTIPDTGNPKGDAGTIAFEVTPTWNVSDPTNVPLLRIGGPEWSDAQLIVYANNQYLRLNLINDRGQEFSVGVSTGSWVPGQSHAITVTWGAGVESVYVDGRLFGQQNSEHTVQVPPGAPVLLGSDVPNAPDGNGAISDFKVYGNPLTPEEVAHLFGGGTPVAVETPIGPNRSDVILRVSSTGVAAAQGTGNVCVELIGGTGLVAGTQNDLDWDPTCVEINEPCQANPQTGKDVFARLHGSDRLRTLFFSLTNTDPITDGVLYCCPFRLTSSVEAGSCCAVTVQDAVASDPYGQAVVLEGVDGHICRQ